MRKQAGISLIETIVGGAVVGIIMLFAIPTVTAMGNANASAMSMPQTQANAVQMATLVANAIKTAVPYNGAVIAAAANTSPAVTDSLGTTYTGDVTIYTSTSGATARYYVANSSTANSTIPSGSFGQVIGGVSTLIYPKASLWIIFYKSTTYNSSALTEFTPVSASDFANVAAVSVTATVTNGGYTQSYTTIQKLVNSPPKTTPFQ